MMTAIRTEPRATMRTAYIDGGSALGPARAAVKPPTAPRARRPTLFPASESMYAMPFT
jgi:hypothetical protein